MSQTMNPDIKAEWVAALRDPEAKQTTGALNRVAPGTEGLDNGRPVGNCCLGVLCEIAVRHGVIERDESEFADRGIVGYIDVYTDDVGGEVRATETGILPNLVQGWAGLPDFNPDVLTADGIASTLATLNDRGTSFAELADLIEAQL